MAGTLRAAGLSIILDIVPNHMGIGGDRNALWLDVLEWGRGSRYAEWFDIDWEPSEPTLKDKVLVPFLGSAYGEALRDGKLALRFDEVEGAFADLGGGRPQASGLSHRLRSNSRGRRRGARSSRRAVFLADRSGGKRQRSSSVSPPPAASSPRRQALFTKRWRGSTTSRRAKASRRSSRRNTGVRRRPRSPPTTSTTGASSSSPTLPRSGSSARRCSITSMP